MGAMDQLLSLSQSLQLSPALLQSMGILQMNTQELGAYLCRRAEENPVLEEAPDPDRQRTWEALRTAAPWAETFPPGEGPEGASREETETLPRFLRDQLARLGLAKPLEALCLYLAELPDDRGYLLREDLEALRKSGVPEPLLREGVALLQSLEPPGIAARDLKECLLLQLDRLPGDHALARAVVEHHLKTLSKGRLAAIAKALDAPVSAVEEAVRVIRSLDPRPGAVWAETPPAVYIRPDAWVVETEAGLSLVLNRWDLPRFRLSGEYLRLLETTEDPQVRLYLREKLRESRWLLHCVSRRESTLTRCLELLILRQGDYLIGRSPAPAPLSRAALAEELHLHPSTVGRALGHKYLQCRLGLFPLSHFFPRRVGAGEEPSSPAMIRAVIARLIREEGPGRPLSDRVLTERLAGEGLCLSRRTVAKYRQALGLPSSFSR